MSELKVHASACDIEPMVQIEEVRESFAARLREALAANEIPSWGAGARLAKMAGVTPKASSKWLNGESMPGGAKMLALAEALGVRVEWLEYGRGPMHENEGPELIQSGNARQSAEPMASDHIYPEKSYETHELREVRIRPLRENLIRQKSPAKPMSFDVLIDEIEVSSKDIREGFLQISRSLEKSQSKLELMHLYTEIAASVLRGGLTQKEIAAITTLVERSASANKG